MKALPYSARLVLWLAGWAAALALGFACLRELAIARPAGRAPPFLERLLGPVASLAASLEWARSDYALRQGRTAIAYSRAETALRLDPGDPQGWMFLAHHFIYGRAGIDREPDAAARRRWILTGLDVLDRGERSSRDPAALAFERGIACAFLASLPDADRAWPASAKAAWGAAAEAFERAASLGHHRAEAAAARARSLESAR